MNTNHVKSYVLPTVRTAPVVGNVTVGAHTSRALRSVGAANATVVETIAAAKKLVNFMVVMKSYEVRTK